MQARFSLHAPWPKTMHVFAVVKTKDVGAPAVLSTHAVLPGDEEAAQTSLRALLHRCASVECGIHVTRASSLGSTDSVALVQLGEDWFGMLYTLSDGTKVCVHSVISSY